MDRAHVDELTALEQMRLDDAAKGSSRCRACGCTENFACVGGCYWVEVDLCSGCAVA